MSKRTATVYLVLERKAGWGNKARVVGKSASAPKLGRGQCAVKLTFTVPDAAFEPVRFEQDVDFDLEQTIQASDIETTAGTP